MFIWETSSSQSGEQCQGISGIWEYYFSVGGSAIPVVPAQQHGYEEVLDGTASIIRKYDLSPTLCKVPSQFDISM